MALNVTRMTHVTALLAKPLQFFECNTHIHGARIVVFKRWHWNRVALRCARLSSDDLLKCTFVSDYKMHGINQNKNNVSILGFIFSYENQEMFYFKMLCVYSLTATENLQEVSRSNDVSFLIKKSKVTKNVAQNSRTADNSLWINLTEEQSSGERYILYLFLAKEPNLR